MQTIRHFLTAAKMKTDIVHGLLLCSLVVFAGTAWAQTRVLKCVAADGSVSYSSAKACPEDAKAEEQELPEHRVTMTQEELDRQRALEYRSQQVSAEERERKLRLVQMYGGSTAPVPGAPAQASSKPDPGPVSYRCSAAGGVWYAHSPCPADLGGGLGHNGVAIPAIGVKQEVVPRSEACHEMNRPGSSARSGRKMDQRASPYEKHIGKDLCR
ncbi:MAG TPA: hypothetical protein VN259_02600 [Xanthomonadales bacterium]|nr:hypothetical protein [Xanthomonadales bacterium]